MRPLSTIITKGWATAVLALTGAAPQVANGNTFDTRQAARGSVSAHVLFNILTNTITFTATWQVSVDGTTWVAARPSNNAADVIFATGTGGQQANQQVTFAAPDTIYGFRFARLIVTTGVGVGQGAAKDDALISYSYVKSQLGS